MLCPSLQHLAGTILVEKVVNALIGPEDTSNNVVIDLLGFDGWPVCFVMKEIAAGHNFIGRNMEKPLCLTFKLGCNLQLSLC